MRLQDNALYIKKLTLTAAFSAFALALSYLESALPLGLVIPLPGVKLGLANIATLLAFVYISKASAAAVVLIRVCLNFLLFGSFNSFVLSLTGSVCAFLVLLLLSVLPQVKISFVGVSVLSAAAHGIGQILSATVLFSLPSIWRYLPVLLFFGTAFGWIVGILLNLISPTCRTISEKYLSRRDKNA